MSKEKTAKIINKPKEVRLYERVMDVKDFCRVISKHSDRVLFTYFDKKRKLHDITYGEFLFKAKSLAAALTKRGYAGKRIAIIGETSVNWMASYIAILSIGGVAIPLDKELEISVIEGFMQSVDADALIYSASFNTKFDETKKNHGSLSCFIAMDPTEEELASSDNTIAIETLYTEGAAEVKTGYDIPDVENRDNLAEFLFTSGTTGTSKCVMLSQKNIFAAVSSAAKRAEDARLLARIVPTRFLPPQIIF